MRSNPLLIEYYKFKYNKHFIEENEQLPQQQNNPNFNPSQNKQEESPQLSNQQDINQLLQTAAHNQSVNVSIPTELEHFLNIEEKYFYIDKIERINNKIDTIIRMPELIKNERNKDILETLTIINSLTDDFLKVAKNFSLEAVKEYYQFLISILKPLTEYIYKNIKGRL